MKGYIYKIINDINDKVYIGQTRRTLAYRFQQHLRDCLVETDQRPLYNAMRKYGTSHFSIELLGEYPEEELNKWEIYWIEHYHSYSQGYNGTLGGDGSKKFNYDDIFNLLQQKKTIEEIENIIGCKKDTIYLVANLHNFIISDNSTKKITKSVQQYSKDGKYLQSFDDPHEAMRWCYENGYSTNSNLTIASGHIRATCNGKRKSAYGFIWKYK